MELFCTEAERSLCSAKEKRYTLAFRILAAAVVAAFVVLCLLIRTENARTMHAVLILVTMALGWACILVYILGVRESRTQLAHLDMLRGGEAEIREGRITLEDGAVQIPKSIRILKVVLDTGAGEPERLNVDERWVSRLPPDGTLTRLGVVHSYIAGAEPLEASGGQGERKVTRAPGWLRKAWQLVPLLGIWALAAVFVSSFVFYQIRDTDPAHKITIYMDGSMVNEDALAARLEKELGDPIRMVQIHPFSHFMFGSEILTGDLYILPDSGMEQFGEWTLPGAESYPVYDPEAGISVEGDTFLYTEGGQAENWRLYIGAGSAHLQDGLARKAAEILAATEKEEAE